MEASTCSNSARISALGFDGYGKVPLCSFFVALGSKAMFGVLSKAVLSIWLYPIGLRVLGIYRTYEPLCPAECIRAMVLSADGILRAGVGNMLFRGAIRALTPKTQKNLSFGSETALCEDVSGLSLRVCILPAFASCLLQHCLSPTLHLDTNVCARAKMTLLNCSPDRKQGAAVDVSDAL